MCYAFCSNISYKTILPFLLCQFHFCTLKNDLYGEYLFQVLHIERSVCFHTFIPTLGNIWMLSTVLDLLYSLSYFISNMLICHVLIRITVAMLSFSFVLCCFYFCVITLYLFNHFLDAFFYLLLILLLF